MNHHPEHRTPTIEYATEAPIDDILSETHKRTFGYFAVRAADIHAKLVVGLDEYPEGSEDHQKMVEHEDTMKLQVVEQLRAAKDAFIAIDDDSADAAERYLTGIAPAFMNKHIASLTERGEPELTWKQWLEQKATLGQFLNILQVHVHTVAMQGGSKILNEEFEAYVEKFYDAVYQLAIHDDIIAQLPKQKPRIKLAIGDAFDTGIRELAGYYRYDTPDEVVLAQSVSPGNHVRRINDIVGRFPRDLTHELVHALVDRTRDMVDSPLAARWFDEAMTEQFSIMIREQNNQGLELNNIYIAERKLLERVLRQSPDDYEDSLIMAHLAFSGEAWDQDLFTARVDAIWKSRDVLEKINNAVEAEERRLSRGPNGLKGHWLHDAALTNVTNVLNENSESIIDRIPDTLLQGSKIAALGLKK